MVRCFHWPLVGNLLYVDMLIMGQITLYQQGCFPQEKLGDFKNLEHKKNKDSRLQVEKRKGYKSSEGFELRKNFLNIEEQIFLSSPKPRD